MSWWQKVALALGGMWCALAGVAAAQEPAELARQHFETGVARAADGDWEAASQAFEASLSLEDRAATRANLVHAYSALSRPLEVVRHALAFLALPAAPHRAEARAGIERDLERASAQLGVLTREAIPSGAQLLVDGAPPTVSDGAGRIYVVPGLHRLEARMLGAEPEVIEMGLSAGQVAAWPRQGRAPSRSDALTAPIATAEAKKAGPSAPPTDDAPALRSESPDPQWRTRASLSLAGLGVALELAAIGTYFGALHRADNLSQRDPEKPGFLSSSEDYQRLASAVAPLSLVGGVLCAQAVAIGPRSSHWGSAPWAYGALGAGAALVGGAAVLAFGDSERIGKSSLEQPDLQAAALVTSFALPVLTYGVSFFVTRSPERRASALRMDGSLRW